jgi:hypothetical protein
MDEDLVQFLNALWISGPFRKFSNLSQIRLGFGTRRRSQLSQHAESRTGLEIPRRERPGLRNGNLANRRSALAKPRCGAFLKVGV